MGLLLFLFLCIFAVILIASALAFSFWDTQRKKQVSSSLKTVVAPSEHDQDRSVLFIKRPGDDDALTRLLRRFDFTERLRMFIAQSGLDWDVNKFGFAVLGLGAAGVLIGLKFRILLYPWLSSLALGFVLAIAPYLYLSFKRKQRFAAFEEQFPEALDFLARSMRAGHAFSISLEMLGEESPDPLGHEFRTLFNEQNLGASIETALANLGRRVPLVDVRFFISAVMLQRQTGGNLSEILTRLGYIIRERFRVRGAVKAASAHGRITAVILTLLPIFLTIALTLIAPAYLRMLVDDSDGKYLIMAAIAAQLTGYYFIRRIVNIKV
jgi:tight adherence protein B